VSKLVVGEGYSRRFLGRVVVKNLLPIYEEKGYLTATFPAIHTTGDAAMNATVTVNEGPLWRLGNIDLQGDALPSAEMLQAGKFATGAVANWKEILASVDRMIPVLTRDGYLRMHARPERVYHDSTHVVDLLIKVNKGPQFTFGALQITGLDPTAQQHVMSMWKLPAGAPMNELYFTEYFHEALPYLRGRFRTFKREYRQRPNSNVMDVVITFQP
jgi:outer membrane protein assembly factor BamA